MILSHHPDYKPKRNCSCGAEDALFDFIPDTIYGINIRKSCCIHDHRYSIGGDDNDKTQADREFLMNMLTEIEDYSITKPMRSEFNSLLQYVIMVIKWYTTPTYLAKKRAMTYYEGVVRAGDSSFNWKEEEHG